MLVGVAEGQPETDALLLVPAVGRLLASTAARLHELGELGRTIQGVIECATAEEHKLKLDNKALVSMFHAFRVPAVNTLASEGACNFESMRPTVQGGLYAVMLDIRTLGVLDATSGEVCEAVCDYLELIELGLARQTVRASRVLVPALAEVVDSAMSVTLR